MLSAAHAPVRRRREGSASAVTRAALFVQTDKYLENVYAFTRSVPGPRPDHSKEVVQALGQPFLKPLYRLPHVAWGSILNPRGFCSVIPLLNVTISPIF